MDHANSTASAIKFTYSKRICEISRLASSYFLSASQVASCKIKVQLISKTGTNSSIFFIIHSLTSTWAAAILTSSSWKRTFQH